MKRNVILIQLLFCGLLFCLSLIFHTLYVGNSHPEPIFYPQSDLKMLIELVLLVGLSWGMCRAILKSNQKLHTALWSAVSLFILFELTKYLEYACGYLPNYTDLPILFSLLFSFTAILIYTAILYLICLLWTKLRTPKSRYPDATHLTFSTP